MWMSLTFFDNLWQFEQKSDFSVGYNLFGQLSGIADQQSCFYSSEFRLVSANFALVIKHTCSWRDKLLNTEQTSENIFTYIEKCIVLHAFFISYGSFQLRVSVA